MFSLECTILDEVGLHVAVLLAPLGLEGEVCHAEGVNGHSVAIDEDASVGCDGVAVGMEQAVGVVEGASVGRVRETLLADEYVLAVHHAHGGGADIALEAEAIGSHGVGEDGLVGGVRLGLDLDGVALVAEGAGGEGGRFGRRTAEHLARGGRGGGGQGGDVLHGQGIAVGRQLDFLAQVAAAEDDAACVLYERCEVLDGDGCILCAGRQGGGADLKAMGGGDADVARQIGCIDGKGATRAGSSDK